MTRSVVGISVVYSSTRKSWNSDPVDFSTTRSLKPETRVSAPRVALAVDGQDRGPGLLALADPGVVVLALCRPSDADPFPAVLVDLDPAALHRLGVVDEVPAEASAIVLDLADARSPWRTRSRSASGCRSAAPGSGRRSGGRPVKSPRSDGGDVDVADLVPLGVAVDPDHPVLRFAVLVGARARWP